MRNVILAIAVMCVGCFDAHPPGAYPEVVEPLSTAGAPAPAPIIEVEVDAPALSCTNGSEHPDYFVCEVCRSVYGCGGRNERRCCNSPELDGEHYREDCEGFCEPGTSAVIDGDGEITCVALPDLCGAS